MELLDVLPEDEDVLVVGLGVLAGAWVLVMVAEFTVGTVVGSVALPVLPALPATVGCTLLGGLVAVSLPKFQELQSTSLLVGAGVGVAVTTGVGVITVSKLCPF